MTAISSATPVGTSRTRAASRRALEGLTADHAAAYDSAMTERAAAADPRERGPLSESTRVEAFSDGVIAIAITLLVLELRVPALDAQHPGHLANDLLHDWPHYSAYVISFLVIGVMWVNHHSVFRDIVRVDRMLMFLNLLLLLSIAVIPFPTAVVAQYITGAPADARAAAVLYSVVSFLVGVSFSGVRLWTLAHPYLLSPTLDVAAARAVQRQLRFYIGGIIYALLILVALVSPIACMLGHVVMALYYVGERLPSHTAD